MIHKDTPDWQDLRDRVQKSQSFAILNLDTPDNYERIINDIAKSDLIGIRQFCWKNVYPEAFKRKFPSMFIYPSNMPDAEFSDTIKESIIAYKAITAVLGLDGTFKLFNGNSWEPLGKEIVSSNIFQEMPLSDFYEAFGTYYYLA